MTALHADDLASELPVLVKPEQRRENARRIFIEEGYPGVRERVWDRRGGVCDNREIERHRFDERHAEALVLAQRNISAGGPVPAEELLVGHLPDDVDPPAESRSLDLLVELQAVTVSCVEMTDQDKLQRNPSDGADLVDKVDQFMLALVRHDPADEQQPEHGPFVIVRRLRVWSISDPGEILQQRDDRHVVEAPAGELARIERRYRDRRLDDVAKQRKLRIAFDCVGVKRVIFLEKMRRRNIMGDEDLAAAQFGQPRKDIVAHRMVDEQQILLGDTQFLQPPDAPGQRRIHMLGENLGREAKALQHRLNKEHAIGDRVCNRRDGMKLMYADFILTSYMRAEPRCRGLAAEVAQLWRALIDGAPQLAAVNLVRSFGSIAKFASVWIATN